MRSVFLSLIVMVFIGVSSGNAQSIYSGGIPGQDFSDTEQQEYLERLRVEDPVTHRFLMKMRQDDPVHFEQALRTAAMRDKLSQSMLTP